MAFFDDILVHFLNMHKIAYFDGLMFYFGKNSRKALFRHFCCSFKEKSTVGIILMTFLDILKNWKRQNGPYPFWRARALIWKLHTKGYIEDFSAHFNTMSWICLFWWDFWAIHIQIWLSLKAQSIRFWKAFQTVNALIWRDSRADRSLFWTEIQATWLLIWLYSQAYFEAKINHPYPYFDEIWGQTKPCHETAYFEDLYAHFNAIHDKPYFDEIHIKTPNQNPRSISAK